MPSPNNPSSEFFSRAHNPFLLNCDLSTISGHMISPTINLFLAPLSSDDEEQQAPLGQDAIPHGHRPAPGNSKNPFLPDGLHDSPFTNSSVESHTLPSSRQQQEENDEFLNTMQSGFYSSTNSSLVSLIPDSDSDFPPSETTSRYPSDAEVYVNAMLPLRHGYPLANPRPNSSLPIEKRRVGPMVGDVGIISEDGSFDFLFNPFLRTTDPRNPTDLPITFDDISRPDLVLSQIPSAFNSKSAIFSREMYCDMERETMELLISYPSNTGGALLFLPDGASQEALKNSSKIKEFIIKKAESWISYAISTGRDIDRDSLYFVTGLTKTADWGIVTVNPSWSSGKCKIKLGQSTHPNDPRYIWERTPANGTARTGPGPDRDLDNEAHVQNQTPFLKGFKIAFSKEAWDRISSEGTLAVNEGRSINGSTADIETSSSQTSEGSGAWSSGSDSNNTFNCNTLNLEPVPANEKLFHPLDTITRVLLEENPEAEIAIAHDDEWCEMTNGNDSIDDENIVRLLRSKYTTSCHEGVAVLSAAQDAVSVGEKNIDLNMSTSGDLSRTTGVKHRYPPTSAITTPTLLTQVNTGDNLPCARTTFTTSIGVDSHLSEDLLRLRRAVIDAFAYKKYFTDHLGCTESQIRILDIQRIDRVDFLRTLSLDVPLIEVGFPIVIPYAGLGTEVAGASREGPKISGKVMELRIHKNAELSMPYEVGNNLDKVISVHRPPLPPHPDRYSSLKKNSNPLLARFEQTAHLNEAISLYRQALALCQGFPDRSSSLNKLVNAQGDPIFIFYAGHGTELEPPPGWESDGSNSMIQMVGTKDFCSAMGQEIPGIPDRTVGALLEDIAEKKGNNITVVLDSCHSASGTRGGSGQFSVRGSEILRPGIHTEGLDRHIWDKGAKPLHPIPKSRFTGLRSHTLISACGSNELARESASHGSFSSSFLRLLRLCPPNRLRYSEILTKMNPVSGQNPQNEGVDLHRCLFNAKVNPPSSQTYLLRYDQSVKSIFIDAGTAHGVTAGTEFAVIRRDTGTRIGTLIVDKAEAFSSTVRSDHLLLSLLPTASPTATVVQTRAGRRDDLRLYIPPGLSYTASYEFLRSLDLAHLQISIEGNRSILRLIDKRAMQHGHRSRFPSLDAHEDKMAHYMETASRYFWELDRTSSDIGLMDDIELSFYELQDRPSPFEVRRLEKVPMGANLCQGNKVTIVFKGEEQVYGFKLTNHGAHDLYPTLLYVDNTDFSDITTYYKSPLGGPYLPDCPLKARGGTLTIGYGSGGMAPLSYNLPEGQDLSVGFLKVFVFTQPLDFFTHFQPSGHADSMPMHKNWGTLLVPLIVRRYRTGTPPPSLANDWPHVHRITHRTTNLPEHLTERRNPK